VSLTSGGWAEPPGAVRELFRVVDPIEHNTNRAVEIEGLLVNLDANG
jgi:hypothetical protein